MLRFLYFENKVAKVSSQMGWMCHFGVSLVLYHTPGRNFKRNYFIM